MISVQMLNPSVLESANIVTLLPVNCLFKSHWSSGGEPNVIEKILKIQI